MFTTEDDVNFILLLPASNGYAVLNNCTIKCIFRDWAYKYIFGTVEEQQWEQFLSHLRDSLSDESSQTQLFLYVDGRFKEFYVQPIAKIIETQTSYARSAMVSLSLNPRQEWIKALVYLMTEAHKSKLQWADMMQEAMKVLETDPQNSGVVANIRQKDKKNAT